MALALNQTAKWWRDTTNSDRLSVISALITLPWFIFGMATGYLAYPISFIMKLLFVHVLVPNTMSIAAFVYAFTISAFGLPMIIVLPIYVLMRKWT